MWHYNVLYTLELEAKETNSSADQEDSLPVGRAASGTFSRSMASRSRSTDLTGDMLTMSEQQKVKQHDSSTLSARLAAAGLADPDILALAQEAESRGFISNGGASIPVISPRREGYKPAGPPTTTYASNRSSFTVPGVPWGTSPTCGSKRADSNSYVRSTSHQGSAAGNTKHEPSAAASHQTSIAGHQGSIAGHQGSIAGHQGSIAGHQGSIAGHQGSIAGGKAPADAHNGICGYLKATASRNNSSSGYYSATSLSGRVSLSGRSSLSGRKPGSASSLCASTVGGTGHTVGSPRVVSPTRLQPAPSSEYASAFSAAAGANCASKVVDLSSFYSDEKLQSISRSASAGQPHEVLNSTASIGAFPNTLHRRTASLPCWPGEPETPQSDLSQQSAIDRELESACESAVGNVYGGLSQCSDDDEAVDITLASPPSLEDLRRAKEMPYPAGAALPQAPDPSQQYEEELGAAVTPKSIASMISGVGFTSVGSYYGTPYSRSLDGSSINYRARHSSNSSSRSSYASGAETFLVGSTLVAAPNQMAPAILEVEAQQNQGREAAGAALAVEAAGLDGSYNLGGKLPVLQEDVKEERETTRHSNAGGHGVNKRWWTFGGSRRPRLKYTANTDAKDDPELVVEQSQPVTSLARSHPICSDDHRQSSSPDKDLRISKEPSAPSKLSCAPSNRKWKRGLCLMLPLLLLLAASGVLVGLFATKHLRPKKAVAPADPLVFQITVAAPASAAHNSCDAWFGGSERTSLFKRIVASAYSNAFDVPDRDTTVTSVTCGGVKIFSSTGLRSLQSSRPARHLMATSRRELQQARSSATSWVDVVTKFQVAAPADETAKTKIINMVSSASSGILAAPLSQFFGVNALLVKGSEFLSGKSSQGSQSVAGGASSSKTAPSNNWFQVPVLPDDDHPEVLTLPGASSESVNSDSAANHSASEPQPQPQLSQAQADSASTVRRTADSVPATQAGSKDQTRKQQDAQNQEQKPETQLQLQPQPQPQQQEQQPDTQPEQQEQQQKQQQEPQTTQVQQQPEQDIPPKATSTPVQEAPAHLLQKEPTEMQLSTFPWNMLLADTHRTAATCQFSPTRKNSVSDASGRYWSLMDGAECIFRSPSASAVAAAALTAPITWESAPQCTSQPTKSNFAVDEKGHLWGFELNASCAFRGAADNVHARTKTSDLPTVWENAAVCSFAPSRDNARSDVFGRLWSKEGAVPCTFRYIA